MLEIMISDKRNSSSSRIAGGEGGCATEFTDSWLRRKARAGERSLVRFGEGRRWARSSSPGRGPYKCHAGDRLVAVAARTPQPQAAGAGLLSAGPTAPCRGGLPGLQRGSPRALSSSTSLGQSVFTRGRCLRVRSTPLQHGEEPRTSCCTQPRWRSRNKRSLLPTFTPL